MQEIIQMCNFEGTKSTKGASKLRRDLINSEISQLRDLLPLPPSTRQRLSQLQLMALVCVYVRKSNYFQQVLKHQDHPLNHGITPNIGFSKALNGFIMMMTQGGKLLFISDNAAEYLGHSMEDLLIHGDSVFDIIDKQDHAAVQAELTRASQTPSDEDRLFLCRMNVSRNARRQMRFGDQKVILVQGHYLSYIPLCSRNEPVFLAHCTPVAMPETRDCVVQGATNVFTSVHTLDMKFINIDSNGEYYLGYSEASLAGVSWYHLVHPDSLREVQTKHRLITSSEQDRSCILLLRLQSATGEWRWIHCVLQVKDSGEAAAIPNQTSGQTTQQPVIIATNQVLGEKEAAVLRANSWLYHYYAMQSKLQYGISYDTQRVHPYYPQVMPYQTDATSHYMSSTLNNSAVHPHTISHGAASAYSLAAGANYLQHYHHPYSVRLHHGLDYTTAATAATRDASWNYYNTTTEQSTLTGTQSYNQSSPQLTSPTNNNYAKIPRKSTPTKSPRRSPHTPPTPLGSESSGGVSVIAPVAIRPSPNTSLKGVASDIEDLETSSWKSSPSQEVPDCYDYHFITPPYSATPSKALSFSFESCDPKDTLIKDHRVPSLQMSENARWSNELPSTRSPWLPPDEITGPLRVLSNL